MPRGLKKRVGPESEEKIDKEGGPVERIKREATIGGVPIYPGSQPSVEVVKGLRKRIALTSERLGTWARKNLEKRGCSRKTIQIIIGGGRRLKSG